METLADLAVRAEDDAFALRQLFDRLRGDAGGPARRHDRCVECARDSISCDEENGCWVCEACGVVQERVLYADCWDDRERITVSQCREGYKPIHHWHERLSQYHLMETSIGVDDWSAIVDALLSAKPKALCKETLRRVLRSVKLQRYNENWLQIINRITGYRPPMIRNDELEQLDLMFEGTQVPFGMFKPDGRKNLLNYNFLLYRLFQLIGREDVLCHFPQLKTRSKWLELDRCWGQICEYHGWEHMPLGSHAYLSVPLTEAHWQRINDQSFRCSLWKATRRFWPDAPKQKATHTYANRKVLEAYRRAGALTEAISQTQQLPTRKRSRAPRSAPGGGRRRAGRRRA